jgi:hypothetical protein
VGNGLDDVRAKIERAKELVHNLEADVQDFLGERPYVVRPEYNAKNGEDLYRAQILREPPLRFSVIVGEVVHDLRSALDHLAWQLTDPSKRGHATGFPVFASPWEADGASAAEFRAKVDGMAGEIVAVIQRVQPHQPGLPVGKDHALHQLHKMNIKDKHHLLNVIGGAAEQRRMTIGGGGQSGEVSVPWPSAWGWPSDAFDGVLGGQAIAPDYERPNRLRVFIPAPDRIVTLAGPRTSPVAFKDGEILTHVIRAPEAHVQVTAEFEFSIVFGEGEPGNGQTVIPTLLRLTAATEETVGLLAKFL